MLKGYFYRKEHKNCTMVHILNKDKMEIGKEMGFRDSKESLNQLQGYINCLLDEGYMPIVGEEVDEIYKRAKEHPERWVSPFGR